MRNISSITIFITILALIKFSLPFFLQHPVYELHRDEYLYLEQGRHLAMGYMEVPPILSWFAWLTHFLGGSFFWVRFWPSLFGALTLVISCLMVLEMKGKHFAIFLTGLAMILSVYLRIHFIFQANFLELFWWSLSAYFIIRYINTEETKYIYLLAITFGCGWLSKNTVSFFVIAFVAGLLLTRYIRLFRNHHLYLAGLITFLIALPNLYWQYNHQWPLLHHMQELRQTQLRFINPFGFIKDQILMYLPVLFVWISGLIWLFSGNGKKYKLLAWIYLIVIILLIATNGKNYYSMGVYPMLFAAGSVAIERWTVVKWQWIRLPLIAFIIIIGIVFIPLGLPVWEPERLSAFYKHNGIDKTGLLKWEDQQNHSLPQDFADYLGWKEVTSKTEAFYESLSPPQKDSTIIYCSNYGLAGALKYYGKNESFRQKVFSDNGSFLNWIPDDLTFSHMIFVGKRMPDLTNELYQHFQKSNLIDTVTYKHSRQSGTRIVFFENIDTQGLQMAVDDIRKLKLKFRR